MKHPTSNWFESQFSDNERRGGDRWLIQYRASQDLRHELCLDMIRQILSWQKAVQVLDIGCALGDFTSRLCQFGPWVHVTGMDISTKAVESASHLHPEITFVQGVLPDLAFMEAVFDLVIALEVLYYLEVPDREKAICEIARVLKPGGCFLLASRLDDGKFYFSEAGARQLISEHFQIEQIAYNHARLYTILEHPLLLAYNAIEIVSSNRKVIADREDISAVKKLLVFCSHIGIVRKLARWFEPHVQGLIINVLRKRSVPSFLSSLEKRLFGERGGSHVIILARRPMTCPRDSNLE